MSLLAGVTAGTELDTDTGNVTTEWTPISSLVGQNIIYNDVYLDRRKVYSVHHQYKSFPRY